MSSLCHHYMYFKSLLETERYLPLYLLIKQRYSLWEFRCTSHTLHVEVGRHTGVEKSKWICSHCLLFNNRSVVGCKYHAFFHCTKYSDIGEIYLFSWYVRSRDLISLYSLIVLNNDINTCYDTTYSIVCMYVCMYIYDDVFWAGGLYYELKGSIFESFIVPVNC